MVAALPALPSQADNSSVKSRKDAFQVHHSAHYSHWLVSELVDWEVVV